MHKRRCFADARPASPILQQQAVTGPGHRPETLNRPRGLHPAERLTRNMSESGASVRRRTDSRTKTGESGASQTKGRRFPAPRFPVSGQSRMTGESPVQKPALMSSNSLIIASRISWLIGTCARTGTLTAPSPTSSRTC